MLDGKWALVTGASKGVGKGIALELAGAGANLVINYNTDETGARETAGEVEALGADASIVQANVGNAAEVERMFAGLTRLDILVNNAGVQTWKALLDLTEAEWDRVIDTNLKGCFLCTRHAGELMKERGGSIVNIGSGCNKTASM